MQRSTFAAVPAAAPAAVLSSRSGRQRWHRRSSIRLQASGNEDDQGQSASVTSLSTAVVPETLRQLEGVTVKSINDGQSLDLPRLITSCLSPTTPKVVLVLLTNFADFDAWEAAQQIVCVEEELEKRQAVPLLVGIGSVRSAQAFQSMLGIPSRIQIFADETASAYKALKLEPGLQLEAPEELKSVVNPYARLLAMCAGVGSPGTLAEVFRGYLGDSNSGQVFNPSSTPSPRPLDWAGAFDIVGTGFQRPFELATLRLLNMTDIIQRWDQLAPADPELLLLRGGTFVFAQKANGKIESRLEARDKGLLGYAKKDVIIKAVSEAST